MLLILFFLLITIVMTTLKLRVNFKDIKISNIDENGQKRELKKTYNVEFELFIFSVIKIIKINFNNRKSRETLQKIKEQIGKISNDVLSPNELIKRLREFEFRIKEGKVEVMLGTEFMMATIGIVTVISSTIPIWLVDVIGRDNTRKLEYKILPVYNKGNIINLEANGIIETYLVHIIYALYIIKMKGRNKENGRTESKSSYRRTYDYSNG